MDKGYYNIYCINNSVVRSVAIHNKNGQGLLHTEILEPEDKKWSQSTIKMDKGYYITYYIDTCFLII